jgi:ribose transport system substrate-binding protein
MKKIILLILSITSLFASIDQNKKLAYIVSDMSIPFWDIMSRGITSSAKELGYDIEIYNSKNSLKIELESTMKAVNKKVDGIIVSPTNSSSCVTILKLAKQANIPVVISDIGTDSGEFVSYISSDNRQGAYEIGKVLVNKMQKLGYQDGKVGIVAIPQKRKNGQARTAGFLEALKNSNIKSADIKQQVDFSEIETYNLTKEIIKNNKNIKAIWLQGSDKYMGAIKAINDTGNKDQILLITFDAEPIFLELIPKGVLVGSAMQQPYLMGQKSVVIMDKYLNNKKVEKIINLPVLAISDENIDQKLPIIKKNVLGIE